ncbi:MAG: hypothetical protein OEM15_17265 [Myxococcales bacterium]|nr:hypothetical protein [Myxococcales bacterium]MDH3485491.1 hypothetical protein [Myxococcales bacterium]
MQSGFQRAGEGLLASAERWAPDDAERWGRWRETLSSEQRGDVLLPLQAALSGLVAFRHLENHPLSVPVSDFRPHLHAVNVAFNWALDLAGRLRPDRSGPQGHPVGADASEPEASLIALERSLTDGVRVSQRLLELPMVDAASFQASCDLFLRDLSRNVFFRPPEPLEFANVRELVRAESLSPTLESWKNDAAKMTTLIAFLALVRSHRFLGIADRQIQEDDGIYLAHIVAASVRRELRTLTRFLLVQGVETLADEFEARLLSLGAHHITGARAGITQTSRELQELRESVEALAMRIHGRARTALDRPLPELDVEGSVALEGERLRNGIRELRASAKEAAKELRRITRPGPPDRQAERLEQNLHQDIWAFRFILRAFVAKASVASVGADYWGDVGNVDFVREFVRHYRVFGPQLVRGTDYARRGPLARAVSDLAAHDAIGGPSLNLAARECVLFLEHLDIALEELESAQPDTAPFDKNKAAAELRGYLSAAKERSVSERVAAGAFGEVDPDQMEAG